MKLKLFSPALKRKTVTLSATQGGMSAPGVTQVNYGVSTATGTVAITVDRTTIRCAPDSVRFGVDLSGASFDTPGPGPGEVYDPRLHELIFLWDTGDTGTWSAPQNVLPEWNDKSRAKGPWFAHMYTAPGSYTVQLTVIEPSSGKIAYDSVTVDVDDPDVAYSGSKTICINPPGVTAMGWGPAGAIYFEWDPSAEVVNDQPWWNTINVPSDRRFLFNPAASYPDRIGFLFDGTVNINHPYIGSAGTTGRAVLNSTASSATTAKMIYVTPDFDGFLETGARDFRINRIDARGTFDPTVEVAQDTSANGKPGSFFRTNKYFDLMVSDCRLQKFKNVTIALFMDQGNGSNSTFPSHAHIDNTRVTDMGGQYGGIYASQHDTVPDSSLAVTGTALVQNPNAISGGKQHKAPLRENGHHRVNIRASECFGQDDDNAGWKLCTTPKVEIGHVVNLDGVAAEGNFLPLWIQQNATQGIGRTVAINMVADGIALIADYTTHRLCESYATGITLRNVLGIVPSSPRFHNDSVSSIAGFKMNDEEAASPQVIYTSRRLQGAVGFLISGTPPAITLDAPCSVYNCTFVTDRDPVANGGGYPAATIFFAPELTSTLADNNILDGPWPENGSTTEPFGTLSSTPLWTPYCLGFRGYQTKTLVPDFTTPTDAVVSAVPQTGSSALGGALSGKTAYFDITGAVRPVYPSIGAWEAV